MQIIDEKSFRIIIVTKNQVFRNTLGTKLRIEGFNVEYAEGGFHLLHMIENENCNLIIVNEDMSDMSAYEMISLVRTNKTKTDLAVLYIYKNHTEDEIKGLVEAGSNEFLLQSTNFSPIVEKARKYFSTIKQ